MQPKNTPSDKALISTIHRALTSGGLEIPGPSKTVIPPETFRLPVRGVDQHFGLTRGFYYGLEKAGRIRLIRIRQRGKMRGITLVPYDAVKKLIEEAKAAQ